MPGSAMVCRCGGVRSVCDVGRLSLCEPGRKGSFAKVQQTNYQNYPHGRPVQTDLPRRGSESSLVAGSQCPAKLPLCHKAPCIAPTNSTSAIICVRSVDIRLAFRTSRSRVSTKGRPGVEPPIILGVLYGQAREGPGVGDPGGARDDRGRRPTAPEKKQSGVKSRRR